MIQLCCFSASLLRPYAPRTGRLAVAVAACLVSAALPAQERKPAADTPPGNAAGATDKDVPEERLVELPTADGLNLKAMYYPSTKGKEAVTVVLLHMYRGDRGDWHRFAKLLQAEDDHAVLVPDLRGHGESTEGGISADRLRPADILAMAEFDVDAARKFLVAQNDEEKLNLEKLCLVGAEMGALVAVNWSAKDWSYPPLATGKQGQTVKALVLLSPEWSFRGAHVTDAMQTAALERELAMMILTGRNDNKALRAARRFESALLRTRPHESDTDVEKQTFFFETLDTSLQGTKLLGQNLAVEELVREFLRLRLVNQDLAWRVFKRQP